jgi:hypothetical protein
VDVYVERGSKRAFAGAVDWPGWARPGRDEPAALETLLHCGPRYAKVVGRSRLGFRAPATLEELVVVARVPGNASTDFGVPDAPAPSDTEPVGADELRRLITILRACWRSFDAAAASAERRALRSGPRGGGRSRDAIVEHVRGAEVGYATRLGWKAPPEGDGRVVRTAVVEALTSAVEHGVEERGPRGGKRWLPRYFVRRVAWHALDHAWEIEDRTT